MKSYNPGRNNHSLDQARRTLLKGVVVGSGALLAPGLSAAACSGHANLDASAALDSDSIVVEFSDPESNFVDGVLARVSVYNNSGSEVQLSHLSTGDVKTQHGVYDINSRLHRSPVAVGPGGVYHFWLKPLDSNELPANTLAAPAMAANTKTRTLQLRIVRGENNSQVSAQQNRLVNASVRSVAG